MQHNLKVKVLVTQSCQILCDSMDCSPPGSSSMDSPGKHTGVGYHFLLQGIIPTRGSNPQSPALQTESLLFVMTYMGKESKEEWIHIYV